ncbi:MAG: AmmeMemoRadiSam system protein B [Anaerolineae bacterium]|nr:AmmeMemoRadiSam system protein B [Anaerolineae bacterium]
MAETIRPPAVAGMFYPASKHNLRADIQDYLDVADPPELDAVCAIIVPHAGYVYSGPVAASAYKLLKNISPPDRIVIMGPAHRVWFSGVALADVDAFRTPLGDHPVDRDFGRILAENYPQFTLSNTPHQAEHCLEVHYPFLQVVFPGVPTVPMLFGDLNPLAIGDVLNTILTDSDFIIVSSDLSHYHNNETAHNLDQQFIKAVLNGEFAAAARGEACGQAPALALMTVASARNWQPHLLDYRTSGDIMGDRSQVVGYAAIAYTPEG